jgi:hypothetical protein
MSNRLVPRTAALSGLFSVVLLFAGNSVSGGGGTPDLHWSRAKIASWVAAQHATVSGYAGSMMELLGILLTIVFAATVASVLRRGEGEHAILSTTVFGAGLVSAALKIASVPAMFAALWRAKDGLDPQLAAVLIDMNNVSFVLTWAADALMLGAASVVIVRSGVLPRWLGWFAGVAAAVSIAGVPVANVVPPLGILLTFIWFIAVSIVLYRRPVPSMRAAVAAA